MMNRVHNTVALSAALLLAFSACVRVGSTIDESATVDLGNAESVSVKLDQGQGEMRLQGGARRLLEGDFSYNVEGWKPEVSYSEFGRRGRLEVRQGKASGIPLGDTDNIWDLSLNGKIPLDVEIDFGAGSGNLDFSAVDLRSLRIDMGVGELKLDLRGERHEDLDVSIDGGIGSATIYVPGDIGVRIHVDGAIGSVNARGFRKTNGRYVNDEYGRSDTTIDIDVDAGIGSIDIKQR